MAFDLDTKIQQIVTTANDADATITAIEGVAISVGDIKSTVQGLGGSSSGPGKFDPNEWLNKLRSEGMAGKVVAWIYEHSDTAQDIMKWITGDGDKIAQAVNHWKVEIPKALEGSKFGAEDLQGKIKDKWHGKSGVRVAALVGAEDLLISKLGKLCAVGGSVIAAVGEMLANFRKKILEEFENLVKKAAERIAESAFLDAFPVGGELAQIAWVGGNMIADGIDIWNSFNKIKDDFNSATDGLKTAWNSAQKTFGDVKALTSDL